MQRYKSDWWLQVDRIISYYQRDNTYLVKWRGLNYNESTWESEDDLKDDQVSFSSPLPSFPACLPLQALFEAGKIAFKATSPPPLSPTTHTPHPPPPLHHHHQTARLLQSF